MSTTLQDFAFFFLAMPFRHLDALEFYDYGSVISQVLYREGQHQAELFIIRPNLGFPRNHRHPDVDSIEYCMSLYVPLIVNGEDISNGKPNPGQQFHVSPNDWHRVGDVPNGGTFLSLQEWKAGIMPTSVGKNWQGIPVSLQHKTILRQPDSVWVKTSDERDAL